MAYDEAGNRLPMAGQARRYARARMTNSKPSPQGHDNSRPRTGEGAASVIPYLHIAIPIEPSHLDDSMSAEAGADEGAALGAAVNTPAAGT